MAARSRWSRDVASLTRKRLSISGVVQGVGFRPFVWRRASSFGLTGWVENDSAGVTVEVIPMPIGEQLPRIC